AARQVVQQAGPYQLQRRIGRAADERNQRRGVGRRLVPQLRVEGGDQERRIVPGAVAAADLLGEAAEGGRVQRQARPDEEADGLVSRRQLVDEGEHGRRLGVLGQ